MCVCVCVCRCVCMHEGGREGAGYVDDASKEKKHKSQMQSLLMKNQKTTKSSAFSLQFIDIVILANKQEVR